MHLPPRKSPFGIGTSSYALNEQFVEAGCRNLERSSHAWKQLVGKLFDGEGSQDDGAMYHQCEELYGFGRCKDDFSEAQRDELDKLRKDLVALSRRPGGSIGDVSKLVLMVFSAPMPAAGSS